MSLIWIQNKFAPKRAQRIICWGIRGYLQCQSSWCLNPRTPMLQVKITLTLNFLPPKLYYSWITARRQRKLRINLRQIKVNQKSNLTSNVNATYIHVWVEFAAVRMSPFLHEVFLGHSGFPLFSKTNISKFQFSQESGWQRTTK